MKRKYINPLTEIIYCSSTQVICSSNTKTWSLGDRSGVEPLDGSMTETDGTNFDGWVVSAKNNNKSWEEW